MSIELERSVPAIAAATAATATTTAAAAAVATTATEPAAATAARASFPSLIDGQRPASEITPVQVANRTIGVLGASHLDETESARAAGVAICDELDLDDIPAVLAEQLADLVVVCAEGKIADIQSRTHARTPALPCGSRNQVLTPGPNFRPSTRVESPRGDGTQFSRFCTIRMPPGPAKRLREVLPAVKTRRGAGDAG